VPGRSYASTRDSAEWSHDRGSCPFCLTVDSLTPTPLPLRWERGIGLASARAVGGGEHNDAKQEIGT